MLSISTLLQSDGSHTLRIHSNIENCVESDGLIQSPQIAKTGRVRAFLGGVEGDAKAPKADWLTGG